MIMAILKCAFGSIERIIFVEMGGNGKDVVVKCCDERFVGLRREDFWRNMCIAYFERHRRYSYFFKFDLARAQVDDLNKVMDWDEEFFDSVVAW